MRKFFFLLCFIASFASFAQGVFTDNFDDGSITDDPIWEGDVTDFDLSAGSLLLNAPGVADTTLLTVPVAMEDSTVWEMRINMASFTPTTSNNSRIWLSADAPNLINANGYYLRLGDNSGDSLILYRLMGNDLEKLATGSMGSVATLPVDFKIRVTRTAGNFWTLESDFDNTGFVEEFAFQEGGSTLPTAMYFGLFYKYAANNNGFFDLDDLQISPVFEDTDPPKAISLTITSPTTAVVDFDEEVDQLSAENPGNYTWTNGFTTASALREGTDFSLVNLTINETFTVGDTFEVNIENVADLNGNPITMVEMESDTYIVTTPAAPYDVLINEIMADTANLPGLPAMEYIELFNNSTKYIDLGNFFIKDDLSAWIPLPSHTLYPGEYVAIMDDTTGFNTLGGTFYPVNLPILKNGGDSLILRENNLVIHDLWYEGTWDDGMSSMERKNPEAICQEDGNWFPSEDPSGGTPSRENSIYEIIIDTIPPVADIAIQVDAQTVLVNFSEALNADTATDPMNYVFDNGLGNPDTVVLLSPNVVELSFDMPVFITNTTYTITVSNVEDCDGGNTILTTVVSFTFYVTETAEQYDIIINEIMADPDDTPILPVDVEYVEIYNRSDKAIQLSDFSFADANSSSMLPSHIMPPNSYLTLCDDGSVAVLELFGEVLGYSGFPSTLTNTGESLRLKDETNGLVIDSLYYEGDWDCNDRTCSMERKNPNLLCQEPGNWGPSTDPTGGTLSRENTGFDTTINMQPPVVLPPALADGQSILIEFDRYLDFDSATELGHYSIDGIGMPDSIVMPTPSSVLLFFNTAVFDDGTTYTINITNVAACSFPSSADTEVSFTYYIVGIPEQYDILINEIMTDTSPAPIALPVMEYLELYNPTGNTFNLVGMTLQGRELPFHLLGPKQYVAIHPEGFDLGTDVPFIAMPNFPSIKNSSDTIKLYSRSGDLINAVYFTDDCYAEEGKNSGGWSLERVNGNKPCDQCSNWRASHDNRGGTPGEVNSDAAFTADEVPPDLVKVFPLSATTIRLGFSEAMDRDVASIASNYSIAPGNITPIAASAVDPLYTSVILVLDSPLELGTIYTLTVEMGDDCLGNPIGMFDAKPVALPEAVEQGDLILNEILYNPVTGGSDFVELLNRSDKVIALNDLTMAKYNEDGQVAFHEPVAAECLLFPGEYVALTEDPAQVLEQYETPNPSGVVYANLPSYADDMDDVILFWRENMIDLFHYEASYGFPLLDDENGVSLERIDPDAETNEPSNWHSAAESVGFATPAYRNSQDGALVSQGNEVSIETNVLSPDSDGYQDFLIINYNLNQPGFVANVNVYDAKGRLVKELVKNELLDPKGFFKWDGDTDYGEKARLGIYVIFTELFSADGRKSQFKHSCVVAGQL